MKPHSAAPQLHIQLWLDLNDPVDESRRKPRRIAPKTNWFEPSSPQVQARAARPGSTPKPATHAAARYVTHPGTLAD